MRFNSSVVHGLVVVSVAGEVIHAESEVLRGSVAALTKGSFEDIIWDFTDLTSIVPRAIGVVANVFACSTFEGVTPVVVDPNMILLSSFYNSGISGRIEFVPSRDAAFEFYLNGVKFNYNRLFCQLLLKEKCVSPTQLEKALRLYNHHSRKIPLGKILVNERFMTAAAVIKVINRQKCFLGEILVEQHIISKDKLSKLLVAQSSSGSEEKLGDLLQRLGMASNKDIYEALHLQFKRRKRN
jgi:hypothetical protein